jgi:hypothetical protein
MGAQSSGKRLHIQPQQFEALLDMLAAKTPPKTQTAFSVKQIVARLEDFIAQSLENHYSFDEIALIIQSSLCEENIVEAELELKGSTLKQYYLEVQREKASRSVRKRRSGARKNALKTNPKTPKSVEPATVTPPDSTRKSKPTELAYE